MPHPRSALKTEVMPTKRKTKTIMRKRRPKRGEDRPLGGVVIVMMMWHQGVAVKDEWRGGRRSRPNIVSIVAESVSVCLSLSLSFSLSPPSPPSPLSVS